MKTAEKIKMLRIQKGMTQEELGKKCGLQRAAINKYEKGTVVNIKRSVLQSLADALGVAPVDLLDDEEAVFINSDGEPYGASAFSHSEQIKRLMHYVEMMGATETEMLISVAKTFAEEKQKG
jgi:transcriptional regulator with XRE-family HTH domain